MNTPEYLKTRTMKLSPRRVFSCKNDKRIMERSDVWKDHNQEYHCSACGGKVIDITDTETGQDFMQVLYL